MFLYSCVLLSNLHVMSVVSLYELFRLFCNFNLYLVICLCVFVSYRTFLCLVCLGVRDILATAFNFGGSLVVDRFTVVFALFLYLYPSTLES